MRKPLIFAEIKILNNSTNIPGIIWHVKWPILQGKSGVVREWTFIDRLYCRGMVGIGKGA